MRTGIGCGLALVMLSACGSGTSDNTGANTVNGEQGFGVQSAYLGRDDANPSGPDITIYLVDVGITCQQAAGHLVRPNKVVKMRVSDVAVGAFTVVPTNSSDASNAKIEVDVLSTATSETQKFFGQGGSVTITAFSATEADGTYTAQLDSGGGTVSGNFHASYCQGLGL